MSGSGVPADLVALHPEPGPGPDVLVWAVAPGPVDIPLDSGAGDPLPPALAALLAAGVLARVQARPAAVTTTLAPGRTWAEAGEAVRSALYDDLLAGGWPAPLAAGRDGGGAAESDEALAASVRELLAGPVGDLAASHGGSITLAAVRDGVVEVTLHGACHGCPAADGTLRGLVETELRRRHPAVREVRQVAASGAESAPRRGGRFPLRLLPIRR